MCRGESVWEEVLASSNPRGALSHHGRCKHPHPYAAVIITHIFLGSLVERNYRAELVHKRYHAKCLVTSVHRNAPKDMGNDDTRREASANYDILRTCSSIDLFCRQ